MSKVLLRLVLFCFLASALLTVAPPVSDAETKVHRKEQTHEVELYVTSW